MTLSNANNARTDHALNKWRKDSTTGEVYTLRQRADNSQLAYLVLEVENCETIGYGFIHSREADNLDYVQTTVHNMPKLAYDALYAESMPVMVLDHDTLTLTRGISAHEESHLFA